MTAFLSVFSSPGGRAHQHSAHQTPQVAVVNPSTGGQPMYTSDAIISIPEGGGHTAKQTKRGMISVPGSDRPPGGGGARVRLHDAKQQKGFQSQPSTKCTV